MLEATRYVFFPELVASIPLEQVRSDLVKHKLALQPNKQVTIWTTIAKTLYEFYDSDPRQVLLEAGIDVGQMVYLLQHTHRSRNGFLPEV